ncbi:hypothetical protein [Neptunomonas japonica]|nr:hypothetical protein [Neptunomonas japonica]
MMYNRGIPADAAAYIAVLAPQARSTQQTHPSGFREYYETDTSKISG